MVTCPLWCHLSTRAHTTCAMDTLTLQVRTPVMLHIGGSDRRCPPEQGLLYYNMLKAQDKEVRYVHWNAGTWRLYMHVPCMGAVLSIVVVGGTYAPPWCCPCLP